jgi:L-threonylcarbamoyladenylate synthase
VAAERLSSAVAEFAAHATVGVLVREAETPLAAAVVRLPSDAQGYARELYAALRALEDADCSAIVIEDVPDTADFDAIRDRLRRASAR